MRLHILVEGPSEVALLNAWLPRFLPNGHTFRVIPHQGKGRLSGDPARKPDPKRRGLLDQLPAKLRAYGNTLDPDTDRVVVLVDLDDDNCRTLKANLIRVLRACSIRPAALFRIAIEETEAFYLGDRAAIKKSYPRARLGKLNQYVPDSICGAWELFQEILGDQGETADKVTWAQEIGPNLGVKWRGRQGNKSPSFRALCRGLLTHCGEPLPNDG